MTLSLRASVAMRVARGWAVLMKVSVTEAVLGTEAVAVVAACRDSQQRWQ